MTIAVYRAGATSNNKISGDCMKYRKKTPFDTVQGVEAYLKNHHHVQSAAANGDYIEVEFEIDFQKTLYSANLSPRRREILHLLYEKHLTQREVGEMLGST